MFLIHKGNIVIIIRWGTCCKNNDLMLGHSPDNNRFQVSYLTLNAQCCLLFWVKTAHKIYGNKKYGNQDDYISTFPGRHWGLIHTCHSNSHKTNLKLALLHTHSSNSF